MFEEMSMIFRSCHVPEDISLWSLVTISPVQTKLDLTFSIARWSQEIIMEGHFEVLIGGISLRLDAVFIEKCLHG